MLEQSSLYNPSFEFAAKYPYRKSDLVLPPVKVFRLLILKWPSGEHASDDLVTHLVALIDMIGKSNNIMGRKTDRFPKVVPIESKPFLKSKHSFSPVGCPPIRVS